MGGPQAVALQSVVRARSETEAAWMVAEARPGTRLIAGGTDLMLQMAHGRHAPTHLVDIRRAGMNHVQDTDDGIRIGACATAAELARHPMIQRKAAGLFEAAGTLSVPQIRNAATLGGNLANASPAADMVPCILSMDGQLRIKRGDDARLIAADELAIGPGRTQLADDELLTEIRLPKWADSAFHHFTKMGFRDAQVIALCSMALSIDFDGDEVSRVGIAWGSVAAKVVRSKEVEDFLLGKKLTRDVVEECCRILQQDISPIDDHRSEAAYRRQVCENFLVDGLMRAHHHRQGVDLQDLKDVGDDLKAHLQDPAARPASIIGAVRTEPLAILKPKAGKSLVVQPTSPEAFKTPKKKAAAKKKTAAKKKPAAKKRSKR